MIYVHSLGRALRFYPGRAALARDGRLLTFRELHTRVEGIAATLTSQGFGVGVRLALLLPNGPDYIELAYACSVLGVIAVPLNTRLSTTEIDRVLEDARPHGIVRHSSLAVPEVQLSWQYVIDQEPLPVSSDPIPNVFYDPEAVLGLIYTSGTTGQPKGVMVTHANVLADIHTSTTGCATPKPGSTCTLRRSFTSQTFPACLQHRHSAPAKSRSRNLAHRLSARRSNENV
ncbi:MAG: AMP-binding protein [Candidatus Sulfotelmatobacter sp.]